MLKYALLAICNFQCVCDFAIDWNGGMIVNLGVYTIYVYRERKIT